MAKTPIDMMKECIEELEKDCEPERALELCGYIEYYAISHAIELGNKYEMRTGR